MKKHLRLILLAIISMIVPLGLQAQEDVTANYLLNPSFEEGPAFFHSSVVINGWNISSENLSDAFLNTNDGGTPPDGLNVFGVWSPGSIADMEIAQTVKNLPAGTYSISCMLTVPNGGYSTQRMFAKTNSQGTKAKYFGATSLAVVPGETYDYAGYAIDGDGNGPFHPMAISIKVEAGDSLVFGIRSNGKLSTVCAFSALDGHGLFKVDNFKLSFISDPNAFTRNLIQTSINTIKAVALDSIPGGYAAVITAKIAEADNVVATQNNADSLDAYNIRIKNFIILLGTAKEKFLSLQNLLMEAENLTKPGSATYPGKDLLTNVFDDAYLVYFSFTALNADFDLTYATLYAAIHLYIDGVVPENLALIATPSTSFVSAWENLSAVNDGFDPTDSFEKTGSRPIYGNWNGEGDYGKTNWVQYDWDKYNTLSSVSVYWWTDNDGIMPPVTAYVEYWENNAWVKAGDIDSVLHQYNTLALNNIKTTKLRLTMTSVSATGICEFKVTGLRKMANDIDDYKRMLTEELLGISALNDTFPKGYITPVATLKQQGETLMTSGTLETLSAFVAQVKAYRLMLDTARVSYDLLAAKLIDAKQWIDNTSLPNKDNLQTAYASASVVFTSTTSLIADFNTASEMLQNAINAYAILSSRTTVTTSYCSPGESLSAVNDGYDPKSSTDNTHLRYGNWNGTDGKTDWVMYEWPAIEVIKSVSVYWGTDGGGLLYPDSAGVDYYNGTEWQTLGLIGTEGDKYNTLNVDILATKIKVTMKSTIATSILEFKVVGYDAPTGIAAVNQSNTVTVYPTMVKRGAMVNIDFAKDLAKPITVEMFTVSGQKVMKTSVSGRTSSVSVPASVASGIYLMVFDAPEGRMFKKIVVE